MDRLKGKIAVITGAARGMGEAEARLFAAEGARVVITDVLDDEGRKVADGLGAAATYHRLDVTDLAGWEAVLAHTRATFGEPDVLVNNAGILHFALIADLEEADLRRVIDINLIGPFLGVKVMGAAMAAAGRGSIINISSLAGLIGMSGLSAYSASKWGVRGLTRSAALELGRHGVRVNSIHPGGVATPMTGSTQDALTEPPPPGTPDTNADLAAIDAGVTGQPVARLGRPVEIARAALYLASDESSYTTGTELVVDGGAAAGQDLAAPPPS